MRIIRTINPLTAIMVLMMIVLGFSAISVGLTNLSSLDLKRIVTQLNDTSVRNQELINISSTIRSMQIKDIQEQQNRTAALLPVFFRQFNQTDIVVNQTKDLKQIIPQAASAINNVTEAVRFLAENFGPDTGYLERENFQYQQANETNVLIENMSQNIEEMVNLMNASR